MIDLGMNDPGMIDLGMIIGDRKFNYWLKGNNYGTEEKSI
jgi:hypothetical protein